MSYYCALFLLTPLLDRRHIDDGDESFIRVYFNATILFYYRLYRQQSIDSNRLPYRYFPIEMIKLAFIEMRAMSIPKKNVEFENKKNCYTKEDFHHSKL